MPRVEIYKISENIKLVKICVIRGKTKL